MKYSKVSCVHVVPAIFRLVVVKHTVLLLGMETSFLMSTILRIGSLMQVGFGSAGTEIIRSGLERGRHKGKAIALLFLMWNYYLF